MSCIVRFSFEKKSSSELCEQEAYLKNPECEVQGKEVCFLIKWIDKSLGYICCKIVLRNTFHKSLKIL